MVDYSKYNLDGDCLRFIKDLHNIEEGQNFAKLIYKNEIPFLVEMGGGKVNVYIKDEEFAFDTMDDMIMNLKFDGKPFIEVINDIDYNE